MNCFDREKRQEDDLRMSYPPPLPISPLGYDMAGGVYRGRPAIVTAMGIMSIVIACLSGIFSLLGLFYAFGMFMVSKMPIPTIAPPTTVMTTPAPGAAGAPSAPGATTAPVDGDDGSDGAAKPSGSGVVTVGGIETTAADSEDALAPPQRRVIVTTLTRMSGMDDKRQKHLDLLLSVAGKRVMPIAGSPGLTMQKVRANITEHGTLPSASGGDGPDYFLVGTGRLECYDDHAVFRPDGSTEVVSASTTAAPTSSDDGSASQQWRGAGGGSSRSRFTLGKPGFTGPIIKISPLASGMSILGEAASLALAIYLLIIGIIVLRDSRSGRALHWWYVLLKIPVVIVLTVAWGFVWRDLSNSMNSFLAANPPPGMPRPPTPFGGAGSIMSAWLTGAALLALAYPIGLVFVLMSRTVREYYGSVRD